MVGRIAGQPPRRILLEEERRARRVLRDARYYAEHKAEILAKRRARYKQVKAGILAKGKRRVQIRANAMSTGQGHGQVKKSELHRTQRNDNRANGAKPRSAHLAVIGRGKGKQRIDPKKSYYQANRGTILARRREHYRMKKDEIQARRRERYRLRQKEKSPSRNESPAATESDDKVIFRAATIGPGQARCEFCQHVGRANEFMPSMRFCSLRCSRAYSTQFRSVNRAKAIRDLTSPSSPVTHPIRNGCPSLQMSSTVEVASPTRMHYGPLKKSTMNEKRRTETPLYFDQETREYFLDSSRRAPVVLAGFGLMPRSRDQNGRLIFRHLPGVDIPIELRRKPPTSWTADDCRAFLIYNNHEIEADVLSEHDVDGPAFLLLKLEHLVHILGLKVGPAVKLAAIARNLSLLCAD